MAKLSKKILKAMVRTDYEAWKDILHYRPEVVECLEAIKNCDDLEERLNIVEFAIRVYNISTEKIKVFAKPEFNVEQMEIISRAFGKGWIMDCVLFLARPEINAGTMDALEYAIGKGLNKEDLEFLLSTRCGKQEMKKIADCMVAGMEEDKLKIIANPKFNVSQMREICRGFDEGLTIEQVKKYANPNIEDHDMYLMREATKHPKFIELVEWQKHRYNEEQLNCIEYAFKEGLKAEDFHLLSNPRFSADQMGKIVQALMNDKISKNKIKYFAKHKYTADQMDSIAYGFAAGMTYEQMKLMANPKLTWRQMDAIYKGFIQHKNTYGQVKYYARKEYDENQMYEISIGFANQIPMEIIELYADPKFNNKQMREIRLGYINGLSIEEIKIYAKDCFDNYQMCEIRSGFMDGLTQKQILSYAKPEISDVEMHHARKTYDENKSINILRNIIKENM